ncbi:unnamed protein product [[Candida] boidinii]|nr:unnamed protein product [[Candida] boidinii]
MSLELHTNHKNYKFLYTGFFYAPEDGDYTLNIPLVHVGADVGFYFGSTAAGIDCCGLITDNHINYLGILLNLDVSLGSKAVGTRQYLTAGYHPIRIISRQEQTGLGISAEVTLPGGNTESIVPYIKNLPASFVCNSSTSPSTPAFKRDDVTLVKKDPIFDTDGEEIQACEGFNPTGLVDGFNVTQYQYEKKNNGLFDLGLNIDLFHLIDIDLDVAVGVMVYTGYFYAPVDGDYKFQVPLIHVGANVGIYIGSHSANMDCCGAC